MTAVAAPPYTITTEILSLVEQIGEAIGRAEAAGLGQDPRMRREALVRRIHGTLALAGNRLTEEQVGAIVDAVREGTPQETPQVSPQVERLRRVRG